jgi:hypothetical protein
MYWSTGEPSGTIREQKIVRSGGGKRQLKVEEGVSEERAGEEIAEFESFAQTQTC